MVVEYDEHTISRESLDDNIHGLECIFSWECRVLCIVYHPWHAVTTKCSGAKWEPHRIKSEFFHLSDHPRVTPTPYTMYGSIERLESEPVYPSDTHEFSALVTDFCRIDDKWRKKLSRSIRRKYWHFSCSSNPQKDRIRKERDISTDIPRTYPISEKSIATLCRILRICPRDCLGEERTVTPSWAGTSFYFVVPHASTVSTTTPDEFDDPPRDDLSDKGIRYSWRSRISGDDRYASQDASAISCCIYFTILEYIYPCMIHIENTRASEGSSCAIRACQARSTSIPIIGPVRSRIDKSWSEKEDHIRSSWEKHSRRSVVAYGYKCDTSSSSSSSSSRGENWSYRRGHTTRSNIGSSVSWWCSERQIHENLQSFISSDAILWYKNPSTSEENLSIFRIFSIDQTPIKEYGYVWRERMCEWYIDKWWLWESSRQSTRFCEYLRSFCTSDHSIRFEVPLSGAMDDAFLGRIFDPWEVSISRRYITIGSWHDSRRCHMGLRKVHYEKHKFTSSEESLRRQIVIALFPWDESWVIEIFHPIDTSWADTACSERGL